MMIPEADEIGMDGGGWEQCGEGRAEDLFV